MSVNEAIFKTFSISRTKETRTFEVLVFHLTVFLCPLDPTVAITPGTLFSRPVEHLVLRTFQTQLTQFDTLIESITIPFLLSHCLISQISKSIFATLEQDVVCFCEFSWDCGVCRVWQLMSATVQRLQFDFTRDFLLLTLKHR